MTYNIMLYALIPLIISVIAIPLIIKLSHRHEVFDYSCSRKIHVGNIPRLGGLGIFLGCFPLILYYLMNNNMGFNYIFLILGMVTAFLVGFVDDLKPMRARYKLIIQIAAAGLVTASGLLIEKFVIYSFFAINFGYLAYPITVFWIITFMNAVNLIDGMDGLSTGIFLLANLFIIIISVMTQNYVVLTLALVLECSTAGFYIFNFPPAKIFLGDGGAYFIGFMYAILPLMGVKKSAALTVFLIPMILMLVPISDVFQVMLNRLRNGQNIFKPDTKHLHHRLMNLGFSTKGILGVVYSYTVILGIFSLIMVAVNPEYTIFLLVFILLMLGLSFYMLNKAEIVISNLKQESKSTKDLLRKNLDNIRIFKKIS